MKWLGPAFVVALAVLAEATLGRLSGGPDFALFFGRFHPLVVHLPIGFFLLVAMGEAATFHPKLQGRVEPALGLLVPVSAVAALTAFVMGQLLALEGGFPAGALGWHRRLTLLAIMGMSVCWVLFDRQRAHAGQGRWAYRGVLGATLGLLSLGAHFGGTMTRGESYLSKYAPGPLKPLLGAPEAKPEPKAAEKPAVAATDPLVYQDVLQPILKQHCVECHGPEKQKGKLRLDSLEELLKGGENGAVVVAGEPKKSPLLARVLLPVTDDDHMPPEGKPSPKPEELALIEFWIQRGAQPSLKVRDLLAPAASRALLEHALGGTPAADSVPVAAPGAATSPTDSAAPAATPPAPSAAGTEPSAPAAATNGAAAKASTDGAAAKAADGAAAANGAASSGSSASSGSASTAAAALVTPEPAAAVGPSAGATSGPGFLAAHCEKCHGASKQKGKLRVDSVAALVKGGANGAALVPGSPDKSSIVQRVRLALGNDEHMPPKKEPQPTSGEIAALVSWIRAGAGGASAQPALATKSPSGSTTTARLATTPGGAATRSGSGTAPTGVGTNPTPAANGAAPANGSATADAIDTSADGTHASATNGATTVNGEAAPAPGTTGDVSGPPDPALLQSLPPHVALFSSAVQPLFREKCGKCHIQDKPAGGLGVDQHAQLLEGGYSGAGIVPKDRKASAIMQRLVLPPADGDHMPPEGEPALSADEIELVGAWIDQGAPAQAATETAKLTAGAARALAAHGVKAGPQPLASQAGGCAACSVPGAPQSKWLGLQALTLAAAVTLLATRRHLRPSA